MKQSPEHEKPMPDILEMECPIRDYFGRTIHCEYQMTRNELLQHIVKFHKDHHPHPEPYFEAERQKRFRK